MTNKYPSPTIYRKDEPKRIFFRQIAARGYVNDKQNSYQLKKNHKAAIATVTLVAALLISIFNR